jgi:hypothetical protein
MQLPCSFHAAHSCILGSPPVPVRGYLFISDSVCVCVCVCVCALFSFFWQGVAEVLHAFGNDRLLSVVRDLIGLAAHPKAAPREGLLWLFAFLPAAIGDDFAQLIDHVLPVVLKVRAPARLV